MAEAQFNVGDTVRKKTSIRRDDPLMTIKEIAGAYAVCRWLVRDVTHSEIIRLDLLEHARLQDAAAGG